MEGKQNNTGSVILTEEQLYETSYYGSTEKEIKLKK